ncbi:hypothetical protein ACIA8E_12140 [Streptomyces sp. NPDC051664]|uniref:hypothetical protein n=1 Tax=Streptomyces sp. NPDC051664 TaxID=3365668 RepID=UPI003787B4D4
MSGRFPCGVVETPLELVGRAVLQRAPTRSTSPALSRNTSAFGHGVHVCLGAPSARLEATVALKGSFDRFPTADPADPQTACGSRRR